MSRHDVPFLVDGQFSDEPQAIKDLTTLEEIYKKSSWLRRNSVEPLIGDQECHHLAQEYGLSRRSCLTVFIHTSGDAGYKCRFERCSPLTFRNLEAALKHLRQHHFGNRAFVCLPMNGAIWYVSPQLHRNFGVVASIPSVVLMANPSAASVSSHKPTCRDTKSGAHRQPLTVISLLFL
jgi:hypothetical protein